MNTGRSDAAHFFTPTTDRERKKFRNHAMFFRFACIYE